jgi:RimJ/RimL family protein N-acetyltransferase
MLIRQLEPADAAAFIALRLRGLQEYPEAFASSYEEEVTTPLTEIAQRLQAKDDAAIFGAFDGNTLCAMVGLQRESMLKLAHKAFIWGVYVASEFRHSGMGTQLMRHTLDYAATLMHVRQVNLGVNTKNTAALTLHQKLGFVEYGLERDFLMVGGELHDEYQMAYRIPS